MSWTTSTGARRTVKAVTAALIAVSAAGVPVPAYAAPDPNPLAPLDEPNGPGDLNCPADPANTACQPGSITIPYNPFLDPANVQSPMNPTNPANPLFPGNFG
jgi:hypothetical protein